MPRPVIAPGGKVYPSGVEAAEAEGVSRQAIHQRCRRHSGGWRYKGEPKPRKADIPKLGRPKGSLSRDTVVVSPGGRYRTLREAAEGNGLTYSAAAQKLSRRAPGWSREGIAE